MCGIAGAAWTAAAEPLQEDTLRRMTAVLAHRGPDDAGHWCSLNHSSPQAANGSRPPSAQQTPGAALGHRRLSIIDLGGGHQPLGNEDGSVWIAFNGEIYNYRELRPRLESQGHRFATDTDTEVIVHLYEEHGPDCVRHLRGMFAFALWDDRRKRLLLARDRLGKKPLFYRHAGGRLLFASELKALLQVPGAPRTINPRAVDQYITYKYVPHPYCILEGYAKLPPAHWATFENGRLDVQRYWSPPYDLPANGEEPPGLQGSANWKPRRWRSELRERLTEAIRLRLRSDVPLGAFLSGGVDSTVIAGLMQQLSDRPVHTFSIGFPIPDFDERRYAREAAAHLGTDHHEMVVEPHAVDILPKLLWHYDEPFSDSSAIPTMYLSKLTRQHVTVALSGDGGDELFAGYDRYRAAQMAGRFDRLPRPLRMLLSANAWKRLPSSLRQRSFRRRAKRFVEALAESPERRYLRWMTNFDDNRRRTLYTHDFHKRLGGDDPAEPLLDAYARCTTRDFMTRTTCVDLLTYLPGDILTKVDIASMAYGLECRSPFLDHEVVELAARMPIELKLRGNRGKRILTETFSDLLPKSIQTRSKMGFGVPLDHWFRDELRPLLQDTLLDSRCLDRGYFQPDEVRQLVHEHVDRQWDHSYRLWTLLVFELWQRMFIDAATVPDNEPALA